MKRLIIVTILVVFVALAAFSAPRLSIQESSFNFGYVPQNSKISHDFWLMSTGDDTLKILKIIPG